MAAPGGQWFFDEHGHWTRFDRAAEQAAEAAFCAGLTSAQSSFFNPRLRQMIVYNYDLTLNEQVNTTTGFVRQIKRDTPGAAGPAALHGGAAAAGLAGAAGGVHAAKRAKAGSKPPEMIVFCAPDGQGGDFSFESVTNFQIQSETNPDDMCSICLCEFENNPEGDVGQRCIKLGQCNGHYYHRTCIDNKHSFRQGFIKCPVCKTAYGVEVGPQPSGTMTIQYHDPPTSCEGHGDCGVVQIDYSFPGGTQTTNMPTPGEPYSGTGRSAFLPDYPEGREVLELLKTAFNRGLIFAVGTSVTTGKKDTTVWNGIHHKTNLQGGSSHFGYPDAGYFERVKKELSQKGIK